MYKLVLKDISIQRMSILLPPLFGLAVIFGFGGAGESYIMAVVGSTILFMQKALMDDDKNKSEVILNSLPIKRKELVIAKYISSLIFSLIMMLFFTIIVYLNEEVYLVRFLQVDFIGYFQPVTLGQIMTNLSICWLAIALYLPLTLRYGFGKVHIFNTLIFLLFFFGPSTIISHLSARPEQPLAPFPFEKIVNYPLSWAGFLMLVGSLVLLASLVVSMKLYESRDF